MKVLLVCTGNTCRSPMAAALLQRELEQRGITGISVESAGTGAQAGAPATEGSYLVALEDGIDLSAHRARLLTADLAKGADLILTMSRSHLQRVHDMPPGPRIFLLGEYAGRTGAAAEVEDPFGGSIADYRATYEQLRELASPVVQRLERDRLR